MISVASANVLSSLGRGNARESLHVVLALAPDLVGLQEWYPPRFRLLQETGRLGLVPQGVRRSLIDRKDSSPTYLWNTPLVGGCAVGARADRFDLLRCRSHLLSGVGLADRHGGRRNLEPARAATVALYADRHLGRTICLINYHLVSGVQVNGRYRSDRGLLVARHRHETQALQRLVHQQLDQGHVVYATGDSNYHGFRIEGLTSAWDGPPGRLVTPGSLGTLGRRKVDDVHGPDRAASVAVLSTASDHKAIVVQRSDPAPSS